MARYGLYSFSLSPGSYDLNASYYENAELVSYAEQTITITDDGDYILDMLLLPAYPDDNLSNTDLMEITSSLEGDDPLLEDSGSNNTLFLIAAGLLIIFGSITFFTLKKRKVSHNTNLENSLYDFSYQELENKNENCISLPQDLQQVVDIIKANGGRITQRDLRSKISYSEAKVSLMVSDLENRGIIEKFKKGRGNIIVLK